MIDAENILATIRWKRSQQWFDIAPAIYASMKTKKAKDKTIPYRKTDVSDYAWKLFYFIRLSGREVTKLERPFYDAVTRIYNILSERERELVEAFYIKSWDEYITLAEIIANNKGLPVWERFSIVPAIWGKTWTEIEKQLNLI